MGVPKQNLCGPGLFLTNLFWKELLMTSCLVFRFLFGSDVVGQFNQANDIEMICRAHQLVMEGYKWHFNETVLTVWSAPNYCYRSEQ